MLYLGSKLSTSPQARPSMLPSIYPFNPFLFLKALEFAILEGLHLSLQMGHISACAGAQD